MFGVEDELYAKFEKESIPKFDVECVLSGDAIRFVFEWGDGVDDEVKRIVDSEIKRKMMSVMKTLAVDETKMILKNLVMKKFIVQRWELSPSLTGDSKDVVSSFRNVAFPKHVRMAGISYGFDCFEYEVAIYRSSNGKFVKGKMCGEALVCDGFADIMEAETSGGETLLVWRVDFNGQPLEVISVDEYHGSIFR